MKLKGNLRKREIIGKKKKNKKGGVAAVIMMMKKQTKINCKIMLMVM